MSPDTPAHTGSTRPALSVVVPVYNSAEILPVLVDRLAPVLAALTSRYELILVNDGSRDDSWEQVQRLAAGHDWIHGLDLARNFGQHNALLAGIRLARHPIIVTLDDDLQHPPEEIPRLLAKLAEGYDVVYGAAAHGVHSGARNLSSQLTRFALRSSMGRDLARDASAFRAFRTHLRGAFEGYRGSFVSIDVLLTWSTHRFGAVRIDHAPRAAGTSNYTLFRLATQAFNMLTGFSTVPLQLASWIGFVFTTFGFVILTFVVVRYFLEGSPPGFAFLASIIALFSGAQLFALGVIGEYLARMHFRLLGRPPYVIRSDTRVSNPGASDCGSTDDDEA